MDNIQEVLLAVCKIFHQEAKDDGRAKFGGLDWDQNEMLNYYLDRKLFPEDVLQAAWDAGYVFIKQSEVNQAYRPIRARQIARPVVRIGREGGEIKL